MEENNTHNKPPKAKDILELLDQGEDRELNLEMRFRAERNYYVKNIKDVLSDHKFRDNLAATYPRREYIPVPHPEWLLELAHCLANLQGKFTVNFTQTVTDLCYQVCQEQKQVDKPVTSFLQHQKEIKFLARMAGAVSHFGNNNEQAKNNYSIQAEGGRA